MGGSYKAVAPQVTPAWSTHEVLFSNTTGLSKRCKAALPWHMEEVPRGGIVKGENLK